MKANIIIFFLANTWLTVVGALPPMPSLSKQVDRVDLIAMVSVTAVTTNTARAADGRRLTIVVGDANVERALKGAPAKTIRLKQEITAEVESTTHLEKGRFLVFLRRTGDAFEIVNWYDVAVIIGSGRGTDRVTGRDLG